MITSDKKKADTFNLKRHIWGLIIAWTVIISMSLLWNLFQAKKETLNTAHVQALVAYQKDVIYRRWCTMHGGVYVPVTEKTQPNPFLSDIPERDIKTSSGKMLTLMNPAYMTRQVYELGLKEYGVRAHITSLKPMRSQNAPDSWETKALHAFERGEKEIYSVETIEGQKYFRLMSPLITEKGCLLCHARHGYKENDIRGGISVSIPMEPLWTISHVQLIRLALVHVLLWLIGIAGIAFGTVQFRKSEQRRRQAEEALQKANEELEKQVQARTTELLEANKELQLESTKHKEAEDALQESKTRLELAAKAANVGLWDWDIQNNKVFYSSEWKRQIGYEDAEISNNFDEWQSRVHLEDLDRSLQTVRAFIEKPWPDYHLEFRFRHKDGSYRSILTQASLLYDEQGKPIRMLGSHVDITERNQAEEALQALSSRQEAILAAVPDIIMEVDNNKMYTWANQAGFEFFGKDVVGKEAAFYFEGEQATYNVVQPLFNGDENVIYVESWQRRRDGQKRLLGWWCRVLKDESGNVKGALSSGRDITERKQAEEKIARLNRLYSVLSKINEAIVRIDEPQRLYEQVCKIVVEDGLFRMVWVGMVDRNTSFVKPVAGYGFEEGYLDRVRISINPEIPEGRGPTGTAIREGRYNICNDFEHDPRMAPWRDEGIKRGYRSSGAFPLKVGGDIIGTINFYVGEPYFFKEEEEVRLLTSLADDLSFAIEYMQNEKKRKKAEEDLRKLNAELEQRVTERTAKLEEINKELGKANIRLQELDRLKSMFIASMSHELRTPLNSVIGFSSILLNEWVGSLNAEQRENLSIVLRAGKHLLALINDVIDVSKIEAGMIEPFIEDFDIYDVISEAVALLKKEISDKRLELKVESIHQTIHTDRKRLLQCVMNLLSNAVKFTEKGSVRVSVRLTNDEGRGTIDERRETKASVVLASEANGRPSSIVISAEDTGIGIKEEDMPKLFQPFVRLDSLLRSKVSGTGLGLYLTKKLVAEILKGEVAARSRYGEGSTFSITIPILI